MKEKALIICLILLFAKISPGQYTYNKAARFNGLTSYFSIPSQGKLNLTTALRIEAWIKPAVFGTMAIVGKNFQTGYYLGLNSSGKLRFYKGNSFVESTQSVQLNVWTKVAVTYNGAITRFYVSNDQSSSTALSGAIPVNSDSLKIGADGSPAAYFFQGEIDDVSVWNSADASFHWHNLTLPLAIPYPSGIYSGLAASYRMNGDGNGTAIYDETYPLADGVARNISFIDYSKNPNYYSSYNSSVYMSYDGYISSPNNSVYNSTNAITLEAWVRRDSGYANESVSIINKGGGVSRSNYKLGISGSTLNFSINNSAYTIQFSSALLQQKRWHHIAATYNSSSGSAVLYLDGSQVAQDIFSGAGLINNDADSLFIGKMGGSDFTNTFFGGELDEVRIWKNTERTPAQIKANIYKNIDFKSPSAPSPSDCCVFGFDGKAYNDLVDIDQALPSSNLFFRGSAFFVSNPGAFLLPLSRSPMLRDDANDFAGNSYQISTKRGFIPDNNLGGLKDSVYVSAAGLVSTLRIFTLIEHATLYDLAYTGPGTGITLTSPSGTTVVLTPNTFDPYFDYDLMTIFDMNADSTIKFNFGSPYQVTPFSPTVKPANSFAAFTGEQQQGWWKLKIVDNVFSSLTGYLNGWGLQTQLMTNITNETGIADKYELSQNYPNPFNPATKINYKLSKAGFVKLSVIDVTGRIVAELISENQSKGSYSVEFNAERYKLSSGMYFYKLEADGFIQTKKMILLK